MRQWPRRLLRRRAVCPRQGRRRPESCQAGCQAVAAFLGRRHLCHREAVGVGHPWVCLPVRQLAEWAKQQHRRRPWGSQARGAPPAYRLAALPQVCHWVACLLVRWPQQDPLAQALCPPVAAAVAPLGRRSRQCRFPRACQPPVAWHRPNLRRRHPLVLCLRFWAVPGLPRAASPRRRHPCRCQEVAQACHQDQSLHLWAAIHPLSKGLLQPPPNRPRRRRQQFSPQLEVTTEPPLRRRRPVPRSRPAVSTASLRRRACRAAPRCRPHRRLRWWRTP